MRLLVLACLLSTCTAGRLDNSYLPPHQGGGAGSAGGYSAAGSFAGGAAGGNFAGGYQAGGFSHGGGQAGAFAGQYNQGSTRQQAAYEQSAQITRYNAENKGDTFSYDFETTNGIRADAHGVATNGVQEQGSFSYKGDDGQDYSITYTADENGYRPQGAHLPTPPPIPPEILEALQKNAQDEAAGIIDDGSYHGEGAHSPSTQYGAPAQQYHAPAQQYNAPVQQYNAPAQQYHAPAQQYNAPAQQYNAPAHQYNAPAKQYSAPSAATSRNYLAPAVEAARASGNGNFNPRSGYRY